MDWIVFAILSPFLLAMSNISDKIMFNKYIKNPYSFQIIVNVSNLPLMIAYYFLARPVFNELSVISILTGVIFFFAFFLFNRCMMKEEASRVISLYYLQPIFILLLSFLLLGEDVSLANILGIALLISSAFVVSYKKIGRLRKFSFDALKMMIIFDIMISVIYVFVRWSTGILSSSMSPYDLFFWAVVGSMITAFFFSTISKSTTKAFWRESKKMGLVGWSFKEFGTIVDLSGWMFLYAALSMNNAGIISGLSAAQPFFVFLFAAIVSVLAPGILKEDLGASSIIFKVLAFILIILGSLLVVF